MSLTRRGLLRFLAASGATVAAGWRLAAADTIPSYDGRPVVDQAMIVDRDWSLAGVEVVAGGVLTFDPDRSVTVRSTGNVTVREGGVLRMRPSSRQQTHRLQFVGVDEARFVGGGMEVLDSDVGLWSDHGGVLDLVGTPVAGWNRTGTDPTWLPTDELVLAPHLPGDFTSLAPYRLGDPVPTYRGIPTQVLNLTRNVIIGGTPGHRAHVAFLHPHDYAPQVSHVRVEHVGPRQTDPANTAKTLGVLGRYGLHMHHGGDGTRGALIEGVAVVDCGSHAFVPHASHGVTFRDCVAVRCANYAYWWDPDKNNDPDTDYGNHSDDTLYEDCAAVIVGPQTKADRGSDQFRVAGFLLGQGTGNATVGCVAAGVENNGAQQTSGFYWDENANPFPNVWRFEHCEAHNNERIGFHVWQNDPRHETVHFPTGLLAWLNGEAGLAHGAYTNDYRYSDLTLVGNGQVSTATKRYPEAAGLVIHAGITDTYTGGTIDTAGRADSCINVQNHQAAAIATSTPVIVRGVRLDGWVLAPIVYDAGKPTGKGGWLDFVDVTVGPTARPLTPSDFLIRAMPNAERVRVQNGTTAWQLRPDGSKLPIPTFT